MLRKILISLALLVVLAYLVAALTAFNQRPVKPCTDIRLMIKDTLSDRFITQEEIVEILREKELYPVGRQLEQVNSKAIEQELNSHPMIDHTECYKTTAGRFVIEINQRIPVLRIMNGYENYFIDHKGRVMPPDTRCIISLPIATGKIGNPFATGDLYRLGLFLQKNDFWNTQIEQIHVISEKEVELIPRKGDHIIYLGEMTGFEDKLRRLKIFYERVLSRVGWNKYARINMEFSNQVICTKREQEMENKQ
jgi:cell division protein FtsQ